MKKRASTILILLMNIGLVLIAIKFRYSLTEDILKRTDVSDEFNFLLVLPLLMVGGTIFLLTEKYRRYIVGLTAICISGILFMFYYLNMTLSSGGEYKDVAVLDADWENNVFFLDLAFKKNGVRMRVKQDKCFKVDSVKVRVDNGFFGLAVITDDINITESSNCGQSDAVPIEDHLNAGNLLVEKRCFSKAIDMYTTGISVDSSAFDCYYQRGLVLMLKNDYDGALRDFIMAMNLQHQTFYNNRTRLPEPKEAFAMLEKGDYSGIIAYAEKVNANDGMERDSKRILFCVAKLNGSSKN